MKKNNANNAKKIQSLRESIGLSLNAFGARIGYTGKQIGRYEKEITPISDEIIKKIIEAYEVDPGYFQSTVSLEKAVAVPDYGKEKAEIASRIFKRRTECGITQKELSKLCECSENRISLIEHCKTSVTASMAKKLAVALDVGAEWILKGDEAKKNYPLDEKLQEWLWEHEEIRKELWIRMKNS